MLEKDISSFSSFSKIVLTPLAFITLVLLFLILGNDWFVKSGHSSTWFSRITIADYCYWWYRPCTIGRYDETNGYYESICKKGVLMMHQMLNSLFLMAHIMRWEFGGTWLNFQMSSRSQKHYRDIFQNAPWLSCYFRYRYHWMFCYIIIHNSFDENLRIL